MLYLERSDSRGIPRASWQRVSKDSLRFNHDHGAPMWSERHHPRTRQEVHQASFELKRTAL